MILYIMKHPEKYLLSIRGSISRFSTTFDKICYQTISDIIFGKKEGQKKSPPLPPFSMLFFCQLNFSFLVLIFRAAGMSWAIFPSKRRNLLFKPKNSIENGGRGGGTWCVVGMGSKRLPKSKKIAHAFSDIDPHEYGAIANLLCPRLSEV